MPRNNAATCTRDNEHLRTRGKAKAAAAAAVVFALLAAQPALAAYYLPRSGYTLITVTGGGSVSHSRGYDTLHMCEEAKSLAMTGETIEAYKEQDEQIAAEQKKEKDEFYARHPPHPPRDKHERNMVAGVNHLGPVALSGDGGSGGGTYCGPVDDVKKELCGGLMVTENGQIQDLPVNFLGVSMSQGFYPDKGEWEVTQHGHSMIRYPTDVKVAECVIEPNPPQ